MNSVTFLAIAILLLATGVGLFALERRHWRAPRSRDNYQLEGKIPRLFPVGVALEGPNPSELTEILNRSKSTAEALYGFIDTQRAEQELELVVYQAKSGEICEKTDGVSWALASEIFDQEIAYRVSIKESALYRGGVFTALEASLLSRHLRSLGYIGIYLVGLSSESVVLACLVRSREQLEMIRNLLCQSALQQLHCFGLGVQAAEKKYSQHAQRQDELLGALHDVRAIAYRGIIAGSVDTTVAKLRAELGEIHELSDHSLSDPNVELGSIGVTLSGDCREILSGLCERFQLLFEMRHRRLTIESEIPQLSVSAHALKRIIGNYLLNALRHSFGERVTISVAQSESLLRIRVIDSGRGIVAGAQGAIAGIGGEHSCDGHGRGLNASDALAVHNGGFTWYRPVTAGGAEFGLALPILGIPEPQLQKGGLAAACVLLLEDDETVSRMHERFLRDSIGRVVVARSVLDAERIVRNETINCVIGDFHLGDRLLSELLGVLPSDIPLIICSGAEVREKFAGVRRRRPCIFLQKPTTRSELLGAVTEGLQAVETAF